MKFLRSTTLGCKEIHIRKSEFVAKTQFLWEIAYSINNTITLGDTPRLDSDWGLHQVDTVRDLEKPWLPLVLITFGDHLLHHLFPAVDHSRKVVSTLATFMSPYFFYFIPSTLNSCRYLKGLFTQFQVTLFIFKWRSFSKHYPEKLSLVWSRMPEISIIFSLKISFKWNFNSGLFASEKNLHSSG